MKISRLACRGIAGLPDLSIDWTSSLGAPYDYVLITGPEASGKTRLLELIVAGLEVIGPYEGIVRSSTWRSATSPAARLELGIWLGDGERASVSANENPVPAVVTFGDDGVSCDAPRGLVRLLSRYDHDFAHGKREYFHEGRQRAWGARRDGLGALEQSLWRSSKDGQKYGFITPFLRELTSQPERARLFATGLEALSPTVRYAPGDDPTECFITTGASDAVFLSELASSEADAVIFAATIAMAGLSHSILFVDRPELYVPPDRLVAWVHGLLSLGTDNQLIIATNSRALVASAEPNRVVALQSGTP
jgi:hypothetical protein